MFQKISKLALRHKVITGIAVLVIVGGGYYGYGKLSGGGGETRYITAAVERGTLIVSVSASGQVSASNQVDIKPKASGEIIYIAVKEGQSVGAGAILASIDSRDAEKALRDAEINLETALLNFDKLKQSSANIEKILEDAFADISNAFLDFPSVIQNAQEVILGSTLNPGSQSNDAFYKDFIGQNNDINYRKVSAFVDAALSDYWIARADYDDALAAYKSATRYSDAATVEALLVKTTASAKSLAQVLKSEQNVLDFLTDYAATYGYSKKIPSLITTYKSTLRTYIGQTNSHLSGLISTNNSIENVPLDIRSQELTIEQRERSLSDARDALANYSIRAPFGGVIAKLNLKVGDSVSPGTVAATFISSQRIAEISLNEVDIANIKAGQKATLTFDAIPELTIAGTVAQIDAIGTVSQGVATYAVKIGFDTQDERVKPGMSVSASIVTEAKPDSLLVLNSAVKFQGGAYYVEMPDEADMSAAQSSASGAVFANPLRRQPVEIGAASDEFTEILGGLSEGDLVVTRTIQAGTTQTQTQTTQQSGSFRIPGLGGGGLR